MANRNVHYEAAFEDYLRSRGCPYVPVAEQKKAIFSGSRVKSFDFMVYRADDSAWLVDVKGRKFPYHGSSGKNYWENWVTQDDIDGLTRWESAFGSGFSGVFVFAYWLTESDGRLPSAVTHFFRDRNYAFLSVPVSSYRQHMTRRSDSWDTWSMPRKLFREAVRPLEVA